MSALPRKRRRRLLQQVPNSIIARWGRYYPYDSEDLQVIWGAGCDKPDAHVVLNRLNDMAKELEKRGYDITTLRFEIWKHEQPAPAKPA